MSHNFGLDVRYVWAFIILLSLTVLTSLTVAYLFAAAFKEMQNIVH